MPTPNEKSMSPEDREELDRRRWERFDRMYYGEPFHVRFAAYNRMSGAETMPAEKMVDTVHPTKEETIWD